MSNINNGSNQHIRIDHVDYPSTNEIALINDINVLKYVHDCRFIPSFFLNTHFLKHSFDSNAFNFKSLKDSANSRVEDIDLNLKNGSFILLKTKRFSLKHPIMRKILF